MVIHQLQRTENHRLPHQHLGWAWLLRLGVRKVLHSDRIRWSLWTLYGQEYLLDLNKVFLSNRSRHLYE